MLTSVPVSCFLSVAPPPPPSVCAHLIRRAPARARVDLFHLFRAVGDETRTKNAPQPGQPPFQQPFQQPYQQGPPPQGRGPPRGRGGDMPPVDDITVSSSVSICAPFNVWCFPRLPSRGIFFTNLRV